MQEAKYKAINSLLNCHHGSETLKAVWENLPESCENLTRTQIADILNACNHSYWSGQKVERQDAKEYLGYDLYSGKK